MTAFETVLCIYFLIVLICTIFSTIHMFDEDAYGNVIFEPLVLHKGLYYALTEDCDLRPIGTILPEVLLTLFTWAGILLGCTVSIMVFILCQIGKLYCSIFKRREESGSKEKLD